MTFNAALAERFHEIARMLELTGANPFKVNAYAKAARAIEDAAEDFEKLAGDPERLQAVEGIGKSTAEKIVEFKETGRIEEHERLRQEVPAGLIKILQIQGLGPKTVRAMWQELGITSIAELQGAIDEGRLAELPGMGPKKIENVRQSLAFFAGGQKRLPIGRAMPIALRFVERLTGVPGVSRATYAGSLRRGKETVGDIDILACVDDPAAGAAAAEAFTTIDGVARVLAKGETKSSVLVSIRADTGRWGGGHDAEGEEETVQADLRVVPAAHWGAALHYFTGSKEHGVKLRQRALDRGLTLNDWGLFPEDKSTTEPPQKRGVAPVAAATEEEIYRKLGLAWIPPELREDRGEVAAAELAQDGADALPRLIEVGDIRAELHSHTTASDGVMSIEESARLAKARGFHTLAITDHSRSSVIANGLSEERLREHARAVREAGARIGGITLLAGSEVDILVDGSLDYDDDVLAELDIVVASPHASTSQDPAAATRRLLRAIEHPLVHVVGHPTGRLVNRRAGLSPDWDTLFAAAREHDVALEINAHWMRLDLRDTQVRAAVEAGVKIAINTDTHRPDDYDNLIYGVLTARRGWLTPEQCINCWPAKKLHAWLKKKR